MLGQTKQFRLKQNDPLWKSRARVVAPMGQKNAACRKPAYIKEPTSDSLKQTTPMQFGLPQLKAGVTVSKMR